MAVSNISKALEIMGSRTLLEWILMKSLDLLNSKKYKKSWFSQGIPSQNFVWVLWSSLGASLQGHGFLLPMIWKHWNYRWPAVMKGEKRKLSWECLNFFHFFGYPKLMCSIWVALYWLTFIVTLVVIYNSEVWPVKRRHLTPWPIRVSHPHR